MLRFKRDEKQTTDSNTYSSETPTPAEVARALTILEAERARTKQDASLKTTLQELDTEVSEEEVRAEVIRQREATKVEQEAKLAAGQKRKKRRLGITAAVVAVVLPLLVYTGYVTNKQAQERTRAEAEIARQREIDEAFNRKDPPVTLSLKSDTLALVKNKTGYEVKTLAEIPDGQMVEVIDGSISTSVPFSAAEALSYAERNDTWRVIKYKGQPYLRAYLTGPMSAGVIQKGNVWLTSVSMPGYQHSDLERTGWPGNYSLTKKIHFTATEPTPITIPLNGLQYDPQYSGGSSLGINYKNVISPIPTDEHLFEKWKDPKGVIPNNKAP